MEDLRKSINLAAADGRNLAVLFEITSLGLGFSNEGVVLYNSAAGKVPVYLLNPQCQITPAILDQLEAVSGDEEAYLRVLEEEGIFMKLASPSAATASGQTD